MYRVSQEYWNIKLEIPEIISNIFLCKNFYDYVSELYEITPITECVIETRKIALVTDPAKSKYVNMTNIFLSIKNYIQ